MITFFIVYAFIAFVLNFMTTQAYQIPLGKRVITLTNPLASFLWPLGLIIVLTNGLFGLFEVKNMGDDE